MTKGVDIKEVIKIANYLNTPGGKMKVSKGVVALFEEYGEPCETVQAENPQIIDGYEYFWYQNDAGEMMTKITKIQEDKKKKRPKALQSQGA